ncbi:glutaredoxin family protein [Colwelliaceae bacterium 6441]
MAIEYNLYSSEGCHLCQQAYELLIQTIPKESVRIIDIVEDELVGQNLVELYGVHIPVLECLSNSDKLFWPFDLSQVLAFKNKD